jgi:hypothetical protein
MSQHPHDDHNDLDALDFSGGFEDGSDGADADALDFGLDGVGFDEKDDESAFDALDEYAPTVIADVPDDLDAIDAQTGHDEGGEDDVENGLQLFTVTNPAGTVSVSAAIDGRTQRVELAPAVANMSESDLAEEIICLADLARQKGLAGQHSYLLGNEMLTTGLGELGLDSDTVLRDFMENGMGLPTPEQAEATQTEVFAARYATDHD